MLDTGRTVVVTGANGGIGLATVLELARSGFDVVGTVRGEEQAATVWQVAAEHGVSIRTAHLDVTDEEACRRVIADIAPWGLVNNAGYAVTGAILDVDDDEARRQLETLVVAPMRLSRLAARSMREAGTGGRIVNVSSMAAQVSAPLLGWYQASKRALEGVSDALRLELRPDGIRVVMVEPGMVRTDIWRGARERLHESTERPGAIRAWNRIIRGTWPLMADPDRVARAIHTALTIDCPRDRYPVGLDSQVLTRLAKVTPVAVTDTLARALFRLG